MPTAHNGKEHIKRCTGLETRKCGRGLPTICQGPRFCSERVYVAHGRLRPSTRWRQPRRWPGCAPLAERGVAVDGEGAAGRGARGRTRSPTCGSRSRTAAGGRYRRSAAGADAVHGAVPAASGSLSAGAASASVDGGGPLRWGALVADQPGKPHENGVARASPPTDCRDEARSVHDAAPAGGRRATGSTIGTSSEAWSGKPGAFARCRFREELFPVADVPGGV